MRRNGWFLPIMATLGFGFLYAPIVSLVIFSFNESRLVTVWGGFSTRWYGELLRDGQMLAAAWISLKVATVAASIAPPGGSPRGVCTQTHSAAAPMNRAVPSTCRVSAASPAWR